MLKVVDLHKSFGGNKVLKGISFSVERGEILGVVGPNGSGKTTLLNVVAGVYRPTEGKVIFKGVDITRYRPSKRAHMGIARTFQITRIFSNLTLLENVLIPLRFGPYSKADREKAEEIIELVGLKDLINNLGSQLSLAQRKRLELARALALNPELLLLDELFAGLNPPAVKEVVDLLLRIKEERNLTLVLVEHVLKALFSLTRRVIVLAQGRIIYEGDPEGMKDDPEVIKAYLGERFLSLNPRATEPP